MHAYPRGVAVGSGSAAFLQAALGRLRSVSLLNFRTLRHADCPLHARTLLVFSFVLA